MSANQIPGSGNGNGTEPQDPFSMDHLFGSMPFQFNQEGLLVPDNTFPSTNELQTFPCEDHFHLCRLELQMNQLELHITHLNGRIDAIETRINSIHTSLDMLTQTSDIMHHFLREWRNQQNAAEVAIVRIFDAVADMMADMRHSQAQVHGLQPQDQPAEQAESDHGEGIEEDNHDAASSTCCEEDQ